MSYRGADGLGLLVELLDDQLWSEVELVGEEFIRLLHSDPERVDRAGGKMSNIEGYDRICAGFRGGPRRHVQFRRNWCQSGAD